MTNLINSSETDPSQEHDLWELRAQSPAAGRAAAARQKAGRSFWKTALLIAGGLFVLLMIVGMIGSALEGEEPAAPAPLENPHLQLIDMQTRAILRLGVEYDIEIDGDAYRADLAQRLAGTDGDQWKTWITDLIYNDTEWADVVKQGWIDEGVSPRAALQAIANRLESR